jgi:predicted dithiol-disulfide oxidoreductase (DUF899 family)
MPMSDSNPHLVGRLPAESAEYGKIREELQRAEVALRDQRERVGELRRSLPRNVSMEDAVFEEIHEGERRPIRLSELFDDAQRPLILMHFMYGKAQTSPCPMCTMWADGYDGALPHIRQNASFALLVAGDVGTFGEYARTRGWRNLRLVSAAGSSLKRDLGFEKEDGSQLPGVSIFERRGDGVSHFYSQSADLGPDGFRGMDLLSPVWNYFDLLPGGRPDWFPSRSYAD